MVKKATMPKRTIHKDKSKTLEGHNGPQGQNREEFLLFVGQIMAAKDKVKAVAKTLKEVRRQAQDAGYVLKDLDEHISMKEMEPETVRETILRKAQYAEWGSLAPALKQGDLFAADDARADEEKWFEEGKEDALLGLPDKGERYDMANPTGQHRKRGWNVGHEKRQALMEAQLAKLKENAKAEKDKKAAKKAKADEKARKDKGLTVVAGTDTE